MENITVDEFINHIRTIGATDCFWTIFEGNKKVAEDLTFFQLLNKLPEGKVTKVGYKVCPWDYNTYNVIG